MKWWWTKPKQLPIPPYKPIEVKPVEPKEPDIVVEEHDTSQYTATGVHKVWKRLTGQD